MLYKSGTLGHYKLLGYGLRDYLLKRKDTDTSIGDDKFEGLCNAVRREYQEIFGHGKLYERLRIPNNSRPSATITFCLISPNKIILAKADASSLRANRWKKNKSLRAVYNTLQEHFRRDMQKYVVEMYRLSSKNWEIKKDLICSNYENNKNTL